eukprot:TRINITY_DN82299_c0_g1_i1.p1 TRINITY_DN82299_c0_g1~~TRINITY_DN82299_c0_g1_i1.p1  ORF type:complete len:206 (-),score=74.70 TRINITY_DN82299_c0_g1_i1:267-884(-)
MSDLVMQYVTPSNVNMGVAGLLVAAGVGHALPGEVNKMQVKIFAMPGWFIICAGLLMLGTGIGYFFLPGLGLYFVSMCMGGTITTAIVMPSPVAQKPGSIIFSLATLVAAMWSNHKASAPVGAVQVIGCLVTMALGVAGVLVLPKNEAVNKMIAKEDKKKTDEKKEEKKEPAAEKKTGDATQTAAGKKVGGRTSSPAPAAKKSDE